MWTYDKLFENGTVTHPDGCVIHRLSGWDIPYFAQHYGLASRFLDWTTSLDSALFFACQAADQDSKDDPCLRLLDPAKFNKYSINGNYAVSPDGDYMEYLKQYVSFHQMQSPVAISPGYVSASNERLQLQNGLFIFSSNIIDIIKYVKNAGNKQKIMHKIVIPKAVAKDILKHNPISASTLGLDDDHLANEYSFNRFSLTHS
ncbi:hypothetical protein J45TS6_36320 [Paenibacillus sp. J45TS6]|uniref:FRG domain-containing protein n=1 Tax=Paenibacillus gallinarum TaxID=2762232 RepID=A0ABR8T6N1_9BACL|nr:MULTISPECIES: FRG domain-containing protein [Paenibacillus]MBD7971387.1 FRG domain-containing protein [Paenibacillus gallinarum]GIP45173.1 hypothetical protein J45TS6_36320 [Paenibacillus sp. J45TS6]